MIIHNAMIPNTKLKICSISSPKLHHDKNASEIRSYYWLAKMIHRKFVSPMMTGLDRYPPKIHTHPTTPITLHHHPLVRYWFAIAEHPAYFTCLPHGTFFTDKTGQRLHRWPKLWHITLICMWVIHFTQILHCTMTQSHEIAYSYLNVHVFLSSSWSNLKYAKSYDL